MGKKFLKLLTFLNSKYHKIYCKKRHNIKE